MSAAARRVWVYHQQGWHKATVERRTGGKTCVRIDGNARSVNVANKRIMPMKHNGRKAAKGRGEVLPRKPSGGARPERFRAPELIVEAVAYAGNNRHGDYRWQLRDEQLVTYGKALHVYNENMYQQTDKTDHWPGAGNACARPYRQHGRAIGMPTGYAGGFQSLTELCEGPGFRCTAKEGIDTAADEIVEQVCDNPDRYDRIYYCKNAGDEEELIGMGVFHIEDDVRRYITEKLRSLPQAIRKRAAERRRALRG